MATKKITLNELRILVKKIIKEESDKKIFNLYHMKSLSPSQNEMVLVDKTGNDIYIYKKEKSDFFDDNSSDTWVLYDTDTKNGKIRPTTSHRMSKIIVNVLPFEDTLK